MLGEREELFHAPGVIFVTLNKRDTCHSVGTTTAHVAGREREFEGFIYTQSATLVQPHRKIALWQNLSREKQ